MKPPRILVLGSGHGWHAGQLADAASRQGCRLEFAGYESLAASLHRDSPPRLSGQAGRLADFDALLTRTMPAGGLESVTFRLAVMHEWQRGGGVIVNSPRSLEIAIDKFATLAEVSRLGYPVPETAVVQSRGEALEAFRQLGQDCVVKPLFGGEGRGVMRVRDPELAWTVFSTLGQLGAVFYVQRFLPPGGRDERLLVIGDRVVGVRRTNEHDFRTNVGRREGAPGGRSTPFDPDASQQQMALHIARHLGLRFAAVDLLPCDDGTTRVVEVNAVPGWRAAQEVLPMRIADWLTEMLLEQIRQTAGRNHVPL